MAEVTTSRFLPTLYVSAPSDSEEGEVLRQIIGAVRSHLKEVLIIDPKGAVNTQIGPFLDLGLANAICMFVSSTRARRAKTLKARLEKNLAALIVIQKEEDSMLQVYPSGGRWYIEVRDVQKVIDRVKRLVGDDASISLQHPDTTRPAFLGPFSTEKDAETMAMKIGLELSSVSA